MGIDQTRSTSLASLERQLVGSIIAYSVRRRAYLPGDVLAVCQPEYFISNARHAMRAIKHVCDTGGSVDLITVAEAVKELAKGSDMPISQADLSEWTLNSTNLFTERSILEAAEAIATEWRKSQADEDIAEAARYMRTYGAPLDLARESLKKALDTLDYKQGGREEGFDEYLAGYSEALESERILKPVRVPWDSMNRILRGGILPTELVVLAARPSVGKSALALNLAWSVACSGKRALFFSLEMGREQLIDRLVANVGNIELGSFRLGLTTTQRGIAKRAVSDMRGKPLDIIDDARVTIGEIKRRVRIAQRAGMPVELVIVDYLQLVTPEDGRVPREQQVSAMSRGFKLLAKELGVPVVLLAQLSRKGEDANREPLLSDLRESGAIEQDADIVIFLHQARKRTWHPDEPVKFLIAKGRSSGVGRGDLIFRRGVQRFEESSEDVFIAAEQEESSHEYHWADNEQNELF